jgi:4-amino-4-deoxy-L-arabinose transferase-like glycosyltransferase
MSADRRTLLSLFALAFGIRVLYAVLVGTTPEINPDPETFAFRLAARIHDNLGWLSKPFYPSPPGYVLTLAVIFRIFGSHLWAAILFQCAVSAAVVFPLYRIGERRLTRGVGLLSAIWFSLFVHHIHYTSILVSDTLIVFVFTMLVYSVAKQFHRMRSAIWSGLLYTALLYLEPSFILFSPVLVVFFLAAATHHKVLNVQYVFLFLTIIIVLVTPWTIRNYAVYNEIIPISIRVGRLNDATSQRAIDRAGKVSTVRLTHNATEFWRIVRVRDSEGGRGYPPEPKWSTRHNAINVISFALLLPFAIFGAYLSIRRRNRGGIVLAGAIGVFYLISIVLGGSERVRLPIEPFVILLAFFGFSQTMALLRGNKSSVEVDA